MSPIINSIWPWIYCNQIIIIISLRTIFKEKVDLLVFCFAMSYFSLNFITNSVDFVVYKHGMGFY